MTLTDCIKAIRVAKRLGVYARFNHKDYDNGAGDSIEYFIDTGEGTIRFVDQMGQYSDCGFFLYFLDDGHVCHIEKSLASAIEYIVTRAQS